MESTGVPTRAAGGECSDGIGSTTAEGERPEKPFLAPAAALGKEACTLVQEGLVGGDGFAVDASVIKADANRSRSTAREGADLRDPYHQGRHHHLSSQPVRLRNLPDEGPLLPEHTDAQDRAQRP